MAALPQIHNDLNIEDYVDEIPTMFINGQIITPMKMKRAGRGIYSVVQRSKINWGDINWEFQDMEDYNNNILNAWCYSGSNINNGALPGFNIEKELFTQQSTFGVTNV